MGYGLHLLMAVFVLVVPARANLLAEGAEDGFFFTFGWGCWVVWISASLVL